MDSDNHSGAIRQPFEGYVSGPRDRAATWEDIVNLPEHFGAEVVGGRVHYRAMPRYSHGRSGTRLIARLETAVGDRQVGGWWIFHDVDIDIGHRSWVRPDIAGIRKDRYPEEPPDVHPLPVIPDWVCEVVSPSNAHYDRGDKAQAYAKAGVPWYWIVDTEERTIEVMELVASVGSDAGRRWQIHGCYTDGAVLALPPFADVVLNVGEIFVPKKASAEP